MRYENISCVDDITRDSYWQAKDFMYDVIRLPIFLSSGIDICRSPRGGNKSNLKEGFDVRRFKLLCAGPDGVLDWAQHYWRIPDAAANYLADHLFAKSLIIGYEMPAWLREVVEGAGCTWLDLRMSPLRFASDLYLAIATNDADLYARIHPHAATMDDIFAQAYLMAAQVRLRQRHSIAKQPSVEGPWVYMGQTVADASLIKPGGGFVRVAEYADTLRELVFGDDLYYKPHPEGGEFPKVERELIEAIIGRPVKICGLDTYEMLAGEIPLRFVGLSSGALQEALWFGKTSVALSQPICQPGFDLQHNPNNYLQIPSHEFLSEPLWASAINPDGRRDRPVRFPERANHLRELHNTWWGYATHVFKNNAFYNQLFHSQGMRNFAGGSASQDGSSAALRQQVTSLEVEVNELKEALRVVLHNLGQNQTTDLTSGGEGARD